MTPSHHGGSAARLSDAELEAMLARAAEEGARRALSDVGLGGKDAVLTIHDMRSLLECISSCGARRCRPRCTLSPPRPDRAPVGIAMKLRWFGPDP